MYIFIMNNLSTIPYKINPILSSKYWKTEYNSKFSSVKCKIPISKRGNQIQIKKPFSQYKLCN